MERDELIQALLSQGARLNIQLSELKDRLSKIKGVVFDWDGVFNNGEKKVEASSGFSEPDSMGVNMLRFAYALKGIDLKTAIITGASSPSSFQFAQREAFDHVFWKSNNKMESLAQFTEHTGIDHGEILFFGDDIIDLRVASHAGLSIQVRRPNHVFFNDFVDRKKFFHYSTAASGGLFAVREVCDLLIHGMGLFDTVLENRMLSTDQYTKYLHHRNDRATVFSPPVN